MAFIDPSSLGDSSLAGAGTNTGAWSDIANNIGYGGDVFNQHYNEAGTDDTGQNGWGGLSQGYIDALQPYSLQGGYNGIDSQDTTMNVFNRKTGSQVGPQYQMSTGNKDSLLSQLSPLMMSMMVTPGLTSGLSGLFGGAAPLASTAANAITTLGTGGTLNPTSLVSSGISGMTGIPSGFVKAGADALQGNKVNGTDILGGLGSMDGFKDIFSKITGWGQDSNGSPGGGWGGTSSGLNPLQTALGMYTAYKNYKDAGTQMNGLNNLWKPDGAYATQLQSDLERRDAAAGRRSDYGGRAVSLQAALAQHAAQMAPAMAQLNQQRTGQRNQLMMNGLKSLWPTNNPTTNPLPQGLPGNWGQGVQQPGSAFGGFGTPGGSNNNQQWDWYDGGEGG